MHRLQKDLAARRLWVIIFVTLPMVLAYPVVLGLKLSSMNSGHARAAFPVERMTEDAV